MIIREIPSDQARFVNELVSSAFDYQAPHTFFHDFPIWASNGVTRLGIFEDETLLSHVGVRFAEIRTSSGSEKIALIGAVATDAKHRGKGLSTELMKEALKRIDAQKCSWSILWGSEHGFYAKLGFNLAGIQTRAPLAKLSFAPKDLVSTEIKVGLTDAILKSLFSTQHGIVLTEADTGWIKAHKTVAWLSIDQPFAFAAFERGMDLQHIVHESGGDARSLEKILFRIYSNDSLAEIIGTRGHLETLGFQNSDLIKECLCLARPLHPTGPWRDEYWISGISAC
ncbi:MAG: GNAT family N-acetyltransferase [Bdellovibrionales bacterium]|nr:GNAT family N-acetyltransferase [Oligoflexia bacterium]